jgi:methylmalonyl-CoA mutase cobalamin-binding domain/chain
MVEMSIAKSAGSYENAKYSVACQAAISEHGERLERAGCDGSARKDPKLVQDTSEFIDQHALEIIKKNAPFTTDAEIREIKDRITSSLDTIAAGNLLVAIYTTSNVDVLAGEKFLNSISAYKPVVQDALLYEIGRTGNVAALTDSRLFTNEAVSFFNKLGSEAASAWFDLIGMTGEIGMLTSALAQSGGVLDAIDRDGKIASEYSQAMVETGDTGALTNPKFLASLKSLSKPLRAEVLSVMWYTKSAGWATPEAMSKIGSGELDVWRDIARMPNNAGMPRIVFVGLNDGHDRGSKLIAQSLNEDYDVIYVGNSRSSREIVNIARRAGVSAIGFSLMDDSYRHTVTDVLKHMEVKGINDIAIFCGGSIEQHTAKILQQAGVRMFGQGTTKSDLVEFLSASTSRRPQQSAYAQADARGLTSAHAGNASGHVYSPITVSPIAVSTALNGARYGQAASYAAQISSQTPINAYLRSEPDSAAALPSDLEEESKRKRRRTFNPHTNADARMHANGAPIKVEMLAMANTSYRYADNEHKNAGGGSISIGSKMAASSAVIVRTPPPQTMATQALVSDSLPEARDAPVLTTIRINPRFKAEIIESQGVHTPREAVRHVEVLTGTRTESAQALIQVQCPNDAIAATHATAPLIAPIQPVPLLFTARPDFPDSKHVNAIMASFAGGTKFTDPQLPASRTSDLNLGREASGGISPQRQHRKTSASSQLQSAIKISPLVIEALISAPAEAVPDVVKLPADIVPVGAKLATGRKGPKISIPVSWGLKLFKKALGRFRKPYTARSKKNLKKPIARGRNAKINQKLKQKGPYALKNRKLFIPLY